MCESEYDNILSQKITEKYHRNESIPASKDICIREFAIGDNEIRLKYHYERGKGTRATRTFIKPLPSDRGERLVFNPEMTTGYNVEYLSLSRKSCFYAFSNSVKNLNSTLLSKNSMSFDVFFIARPHGTS